MIQVAMSSAIRGGGRGTWSLLVARRHRLARGVRNRWTTTPTTTKNAEQQGGSFSNSSDHPATDSRGGVTTARASSRNSNNHHPRNTNNDENGGVMTTAIKKTNRATPIPAGTCNQIVASIFDEIRKSLDIMPTPAINNNNINNNNTTSSSTATISASPATARHNMQVQRLTAAKSSLRDRHSLLLRNDAVGATNPSFQSVATATASTARSAGAASVSLRQDANLTATTATSSTAHMAPLPDIFDIPDLPPQESVFNSHSGNNNDNDDAWEHYVKMMEILVKKDPHFRKEHTAKPIPVEKTNAVITFLLSRPPCDQKDGLQHEPTTTTTTRTLLRQALERHGGGSIGGDGDKTDTTTHKKSSNSFSKDLYDQRRAFMEEYGLDMVQYNMIERSLFQITNICAKMAHGRPAPVIWRKTLQAATSSKMLLQNLMHVATFAPLTTTSNNNSSTSSRQRRLAKNKYTTMSILDILNDHHDNSINSSNSSNSFEENDAEVAEADAVLDLVDMVDEIAIYHDLLHDATEQTINVRVRLLVAQGKAQQAALLLHQHANEENFNDNSGVNDDTIINSTGNNKKRKNHVLLRLRSYAPVLSLFLDQGDLKDAIRLFQEMRRNPSVHLDANTYMQLLAGIAERGGFRPDYVPAVVESDNESNSDITIRFGPSLLDRLASDMAEEVIEISAAAARRLYNALAEGFPNVEGLEKTKSLLTPLPVNNTPASSDQSIFASRVTIDPHTGTCPRTGIKLVLKSLTPEQSHHLRESIMRLARVSHVQNKMPFVPPNRPPASQKDNHNNNHDMAEAAVQSLQKFYHWLDARQGEPYTVIVDGPNIGYFMQNFENGRFSYHQIQFVVDYLERLGERPLVILPRKYTFDFFNVFFEAGGGAPQKQRLTSAEKRIRDELSESGKICAVPPGQHDDYFWILASTTKQTACTGGKDIYVSPSSTTTALDDHGDYTNLDHQHNRWPGIRPVVLTNDNVGDHNHKLGLLESVEPMLLRRWYSNCIVNYNFAPFVGSDCTHPNIGFHPADFFSREIQGNRRIGNNDNDRDVDVDVDGSSSSMVWHFPIADRVDEWFCISIRSPTK